MATISNSLPPSLPYESSSYREDSSTADESYYPEVNMCYGRNGALATPCSGSRTSQSDALDIIGQESKQLMQSIKDVRALGVEDHDLRLPKLCVVGGQSTGKSSLIEGMSGIRVPRAHGTCTRCPLEINLSEASDDGSQWTCRVSLVRKYFYDESRKPSQPGPKNLFGPWLRLQPPESFHFCTINRKELVEDALKWAHLATLNPGKDYQIYKPGNNSYTDESMQANFSPNVVRLDISGPGLPNLCFYDMPGVIALAEDKYSVKLVENLVKDHIRADNCIILHTLTMNTDYQNDVSGRLIKELGLDAIKRTVGVLTKPDCVGSGGGSFDQWTDILEGRKWPLPLKYYVVKNSSNPQTSHDQARAEEAYFFESVEPFASELRAHKDFFGTRRLQDALSRLLAGQIRENLPSLQKRIEVKIKELEDELELLPKPLDHNISLFVGRNLDKFREAISKEIRGGCLEHQFFTIWQNRAIAMRDLLVDSWPRLLFPSRDRRCQLAGESLPIRSTSDASNSPPIQTIEPSVINIDDDDEQPNRRRKAPDADNSMHPPAKRIRTSNPFTDRKDHIQTDLRASELAKKFTMKRVRDLINGINKGLPGARDVKVTEQMHIESVGHWHRVLDEFRQETEIMTKNLVDGYFQAVFVEWGGTEMHELIKATLKSFLDKSFAKQKKKFAKLLEDETKRILTLDSGAKRSREQETLTLLRRRSRAMMFETECTAALGQNEGVPLSGIQRKAIEVEIARRSVVDFDSEIQEMATERAYYGCSSQRFADNVTRSVCSSLFEKCENELVKELVEVIGIEMEDANIRCKRLLQPNSATLKRRDDLMLMRTKLEEAHRRLSELSC